MFFDAKTDGASGSDAVATVLTSNSHDPTHFHFSVLRTIKYSIPAGTEESLALERVEKEGDGSDGWGPHTRKNWCEHFEYKGV